MTDHSDKNEANLGDFIKRIKSEGIDEASKEAEEIVGRARDEAGKIVEEANKKADHIIRNAGKEVEERKLKGIESLKLAARDSALALRRTMEETFRSVIFKECNESLTGEALQSLLRKVVEAWSAGNQEGEALEILLSQKDMKGLSDSFVKKLGKELERGLHIKGRSVIKGGFRAGVKGGDMYYDFSDEAVAELLFNHLAPELAAILDERGKKEETK